MTELPSLLEKAFDESADEWLQLGRILSTDPSAGLAHSPACAPNASDLGLMLAWSRIVAEWARQPKRTLVICDDPWLSRHLSGISGVMSGRRPNLLAPACRLYIRGLLARTRRALRFVAWSIRLRMRTAGPTGAASLLVYGHPASTTDGVDGYFGDLMRHLPDLRRMLHVDCPLDRALALGADGRTESLHGYGSPAYAVVLPLLRWRPRRTHLKGPNGWLIRRAAAREGGTGTAAAIAWQRHCQGRWLRLRRPAVVAWPWENHAWERAFVRAARHAGVRSLGYQHSVIGRQMLNYSPASNPDGPNGLPDIIVCNGGATLEHLRRWGVPEERLTIGGALRFVRQVSPPHDRKAPVFLALPFDGKTAGEMVAAAHDAARAGHCFVVKDHPMTPFLFDDTEGVRRTAVPLSKQPAVSAVVYAATTVGLEAIMAGLPTLRFRPRAHVSIDILPAGIAVPTVDAATLGAVLNASPMPPPVVTEEIFAPVNDVFWRTEFETGRQA